MKKIYDLRINSHGKCEPMYDGFFRKTADSACFVYNESDYTLVECPRAVYRIPSYYLNNACYSKDVYEKYIRRAMMLGGCR